jgi:hypothetical protein
MLTWQCRIPGKPGTKWEDGLYPVTLKFTENYPATPPECTFPAGFIHPNVYSNGKVRSDDTWQSERLLNCRYMECTQEEQLAVHSAAFTLGMRTTHCMSSHNAAS